MSDTKLAEELVKILHRPDGNPKLRPVHSLGIGVTGSFEATPIARNYCIAEHFQGGRIPVTVRYSNASGSATRTDGWSDVRGMATRFHLDDGSDTDLITMTLPEFFTPDGETFLDFAIAAFPKPYSAESPWQKIKNYLALTLPKRNPYPGEKISPDDGAKDFANKHSYSQLAVMTAATIGAPVSYARASYHAVHTFIVTAPDNVRRWVRFTWQPIEGVLNTDPAKTPVDDYLDAELRDRLSGQGTARFSLMMTIGENGDDMDDPTRPWPLHRMRVAMGILTIDTVLDAEQQRENIEKMSYNPWLLTKG
ncbi:MAG: catalase, partial [Hyphomonadaceae bacterium]|nr:catalase [Hyphomonadaceae bacterium]